MQYLFDLIMFYHFRIKIKMEEYQFKAHNVWGKQSSVSQEIVNFERPTEKIIMNQFQKLKNAKDRFNLFIEEIKNDAYTPLREDIINYCQGHKKILQEKLKPDSIMKKIQIRIDKMLKTKRIKRNWGTQDLCILIWIISKYCDYKGIENLQKDITMEDWNFISTLIPGVSGQSCMFKWLSIKKITLANHNWTRMQSELLGTIVKQKIDFCENGQIKDWKEISQDLYRYNSVPQKVYRNAKQCRQHWTCYLSPQLKKGPWQLYEDVKLLKFIKDNKGLKKWSQIARFFEGRTQNALKNRYTLIIEKQKKPPKNRHKPQLQLISEFLQKCYVDQFTTNIKFEEEEDSIYEDDEASKSRNNDIEDSQNKIPFIKKQEAWHDTKESNQICQTPLKVQKFNIMDFQAMSLSFFKNIQPGVIESDGTFKKIENTGIKLTRGDSIQQQFMLPGFEKKSKFTQ